MSLKAIHTNWTFFKSMLGCLHTKASAVLIQLYCYVMTLHDTYIHSVK